MKSIEQISAAVIKRIHLTMLHEMPEPTCPVAKQKWRWQQEQVRKKVAAYLWPENNGVSIEIRP